jgi:hypothetical protein
MKHFLLIWFIVLASVACDRATPALPVNNTEQAQSGTPSANPIITVDSAYENRASNISVEGQGTVVKVLADDTNGSRHQKFLVKVASGKTLLFAHNIDLAQRVEDIKIGDQISFRGEYVFNPKGGVIHWTHKDPRGKHVAGWIKHNDKTYQ